jgi:hypothetical protein
LAFSVNALDNDPLFFERDRNFDGLMSDMAADMHLPLEDEPPLNHEHFLDHRDDDDAVFSPDRRFGADDLVDRDAGHLDLFFV